MGPVNTKMHRGRGDALQAISKIVSEFTCGENLAILRQKYELLAEEEQEDLKGLLEDADLEELLEDEHELSIYLTDFVDYQQQLLLQKIFAFMDAHPRFLPGDESQPVLQEESKEAGALKGDVIMKAEGVQFTVRWTQEVQLRIFSFLDYKTLITKIMKLSTTQRLLLPRNSGFAKELRAKVVLYEDAEDTRPQRMLQLMLATHIDITMKLG